MVGGVVFGALGFLLAPQIARSVLGALASFLCSALQDQYPILQHMMPFYPLIAYNKSSEAAAHASGVPPGGAAFGIAFSHVDCGNS